MVVLSELPRLDTTDSPPPPPPPLPTPPPVLSFSLEHPFLSKESFWKVGLKTNRDCQQLGNLVDRCLTSNLLPQRDHDFCFSRSHYTATETGEETMNSVSAGQIILPERQGEETMSSDSAGHIIITHRDRARRP